MYPIITFVRLREAIDKYQATLAANSGSGDVASISWICRNILELRIWIEFCGKSAENAIEFYEDAIRDLVDMNKKDSDLDDATAKVLDRAKSTLSRPDKPHKFRDVKDAAEAVGLKSSSEHRFKLLAKFIHPTAMAIIAPLGKEFTNQMIAKLVQEYGGIAVEAIKSLESSELSLAGKSKLNLL